MSEELPGKQRPDEELTREQCAACGAESSVEARSAQADPTLCPNCGAEMAEASLVRKSSKQTETDPALELSLKAPTTQQLLLDRLLTAPPIPTQIPQATLLVILFTIVAAGIGVYLVTKPVDKFLPEQADQNPGQSDPHAGLPIDTTELHQKRVFYQPVIDSLKQIAEKNPADTATLRGLGNVYFDVQYWADCARTYEAYLKLNPTNADIRVEYAAAIDQSQHDHEAALNQIEKALEDDPKNVRGLFTGGMLASMKIGASGNHAEAIAQAKDYFTRARAAAQERDTSVLPAIDDMLSKFEAMKAPSP